jgi:septum formation protein
MELLLASTSPYRRALLERLGVPFRVQAPRVDEGAWKARLGPVGPRELAGLLADAKAADVAAESPSAVVVASDQLVAFEGRPLGKPGSVEAAIEQLARLSGATHELITALVVRHGEAVHRHMDVSRLTLRRLSRTEIARYVEAERPVDCAGSYKFEGRGIALFERVETDDPTAITGLPLIALTTILRGLGCPIP